MSVAIANVFGPAVYLPEALGSGLARFTAICYLAIVISISLFLLISGLKNGINGIYYWLGIPSVG